MHLLRNNLFNICKFFRFTGQSAELQLLFPFDKHDIMSVAAEAKYIMCLNCGIRVTESNHQLRALGK